jgi:hypothetical protein
MQFKNGDKVTPHPGVGSQDWDIREVVDATPRPSLFGNVSCIIVRPVLTPGMTYSRETYLVPVDHLELLRDEDVSVESLERLMFEYYSYFPGGHSMTDDHSVYQKGVRMWEAVRSMSTLVGEGIMGEIHTKLRSEGRII